MRLNPITLPTYKDIFDDDPERLIASINAIPVQFVITMCFLNVKFYFTDNHNDLDGYIRDTLFGRALFSTQDGREILKWMQLKKNSKILDSYTIQGLYVILFSFDAFLPVDHVIETDDELLLLKLVLIANQKRLYTPNRQKLIDDNIDIKNLTADFFQNIVWANNLAQIDININSNFMFEACRCFAMMQFLNSAQETKPIIEDFLRYRQIDSIATYSIFLTLVIQHYYVHYDKDNFDNLEFKILSEPQTEAVFTPLCITSKPNSLLDIKTHPVFHLDDSFYILDLNYFTSQIYTGTYKTLKEEINKTTGEGGLKTQMGSLMESRLLKPIFSNAFGRISSKMKFDCDFINRGYPDALLQIGNSIFLVELKDNLLADDIMESLDFEIIKNKLEEVFVESTTKKKTKPKAVAQIINNIEKLLNGEYANNDLGFNYDRSNIIYPIILYTDYKYSSSGIGYYIRKRFLDKAKENSRICRYIRQDKIKPVTFIGLDFFFNNMFSFAHDQGLLKKLIDAYNVETKKEELINSKSPAPFERDLFPSFERFHSDFNYSIPPIDDPMEFLELFGIKFPKYH